MSAFLTIALFLVGIPAVILSVMVWLKITRSFFNDSDYDSEMLPDHENTSQFRGKGGHEDAAQTSHKAGTSDTLNERMIQSG
ncbi:MAG TPA: hypothetical protein VKA13_00445 [Gammaproteobacteria bacterium]|nr:hypothetical protein [Gammaproteobacteria bacterium]